MCIAFPVAHRLYLPSSSTILCLSRTDDSQTCHLAARRRYPTIAKFHTLLLSEKPSWAMSEKQAFTAELEKLEPLAQHQGLGLEYTSTVTSHGPGPSSSPLTTGHKAAHIYPSFTLVEGLDVSK